MSQNLMKKYFFFGEINTNEKFGRQGILQFLDPLTINKLSSTNKTMNNYCTEFQFLNDINKKKLTQQQLQLEKLNMQKIRSNFLETRNKLSSEEQGKLDEEFFKHLTQEGYNLEQTQELFKKGASISFLKEDHVFDNFSTFIRFGKYTIEKIERYKIFINSVMKIEDLSSQTADYTEGETFFQILFRQCFQHMWNGNTELIFKGAYELFYQSALNFDISLGVKDLLETPYYQIFQNFEYCYEPQFINKEKSEKEKEFQTFFYLVDPKENPKDFEYQLKFIDLIADNLEKLEESPNKVKSELNISEHYNLLFSNWDELEGFYKSRVMNSSNNYEKYYNAEIESDIQTYEKLVKILVELVSIFAKYKKAFLRDLLDKLFLKFKGLVFKYFEKDNTIEESIKQLTRNYLLKTYFGVDLNINNKENHYKMYFNSVVDYDHLIEKSDFFKSLEREYFENEEEIKILYNCLITFYRYNNKLDVIQEILKFEKENNFNRFDTFNLKHPITGEKLMIE